MNCTKSSRVTQMDLILFAIFFALAMLGLAAQQWGVDSRQTSVDPRCPTSSTGLF
ncbi:MAG: hypothetical protein H0V73_01395 [Chloroflexi bacterium]|nr:hypothetical protein [Chloroflexota bacterium]